VEKPRALQQATGADELLVTTTHGHKDPVRSHELLADAWLRQDS
jgi:hypothetical protein